MSGDALDLPPANRPPGYLVFEPMDVLVQPLTWLCRQGCLQATGALGCSRQGASSATETCPDLELCLENHPFLQRLDDELLAKSAFGMLLDL